jgi:hypothetical protein
MAACSMGCHFALVVSLSSGPDDIDLSQETRQPSNIGQHTKAMCEVLHIGAGFFCVSGWRVGDMLKAQMRF